MHGFLNIAKPLGVTSHDVVAQVRRLTGIKRIGHAGTLDPAATGVLPLALGGATRLVEYLADTDKTYRAQLRLGITTSTDDSQGALLLERTVPPLEIAELDQALQRFRGSIEQVPPLYSALHYEGQRMYDLARAGAQIELPARQVVIHRLAIVEWNSPLLTIDVDCGKGVYIRALARDLGALLECGAHLAALSRTRVGGLRLDDAVTLDQLPENRETLRQKLLPPELAVADWPRIDVDEGLARRLRNGLPIRATGSATQARVHGADGMLLALVQRDADLWRPHKVFAFE